jgi:hypothetical protein
MRVGCLGLFGLSRGLKSWATAPKQHSRWNLRGCVKEHAQCFNADPTRRWQHGCSSLNAKAASPSNQWPLIPTTQKNMRHSIPDPNVELWHRLPEAPLRNRVKGCSQEGHFDSGRVAGCPPPSCSPCCPPYWNRCLEWFTLRSSGLDESIESAPMCFRWAKQGYCKRKAATICLASSA